MSEYIYHSNGEPLANEHGEISLALAGAIVRCRDCKHFCQGNNDFPHTCDIWRAKEDARIEPDGFCAWAERREE